MADVAQVATLGIKVDSSQVASATRDLDRLGSVSSRVEGLIGKLVGVFAAFKVASFVKDSALLAARYETLGVAMGAVGNNAGYTAEQMENFAQKVQKMGISMIESRQVMTMMAGAQMDLAKSAELARVAQDAAVIGNINSSEAFERMVQGIRSGETEVLRTIGINVNFERSYEALGRQLKKNAKDLTENEKMQARTNAVLDDGAKKAGVYEAAMTTAGKQLTSMDRLTKDLKTGIGEIFGPAFTHMVTQANKAFASANDWMKQNSDAMTEAKISMLAASQQATSLTSDLLRLAGVAGELTGELTPLEIGAQMVATAMALLRDIVSITMGTVKFVFADGAKAVLDLTEIVLRLVAAMHGLSRVKMPEWFQRLQDRAYSARESGLDMMQGGALNEVSEGSRAREEYQKQVDALRKVKEAQGESAAAAGRDARAKQELAEKTRAAAEAAQKLAKEQTDWVDGLRREAATYGHTRSEIIQYEIGHRNLTGTLKERARLVAEFFKEQEKEEASKKRWAESERQWGEAISATNHMLETRDRMQREKSKQFFDDLDYVRREVESPDQQAQAEIQRLLMLRQAWGLYADEINRRLMEVSRRGLSTAGMIGDALAVSMEKASDAFAQFVTTGKGSFKELVSSILADLARMWANKAFSQLFSYVMAWAGNQLFSGASGASSSGSGISWNWTTGGSAAGSSSASAAAGSAIGSVGITVNVGGGKAETSSSASTAEGKRMAHSLEAMLNSWAVNEMLPGGVLYRRA